MESLHKQIHQGNITHHDIEAKHYDLIHCETFNNHEQRRIVSVLKCIDKLIKDNQGRALDFGAGTGNLTEKLLNMGYHVTAIDISTEMCEILQTKYVDFVKNERLKIIHSKIENIHFKDEEFDLITCYSVLHHLPDYIEVIRNLSTYLKKEGVMYLDHEVSSFFWDERKSYKTVKYIFFQSVRILNLLSRLFYLKQYWSTMRSLDYSLSDYWTKKEHHIDHDKIRSLFDNLNFRCFYKEDYHLYRTKLPNLMYYIYKQFYNPDMSLWIAIK